MMSNYLIEFGLVHFSFFIVYRLILKKETQIYFLRGYLIGATILSLAVPFIHLSGYAPIQNIDVTASVSTIVFPAIEITSSNSAWYKEISFIGWAYIVISNLVLLHMALGLFTIIKLYLKSQPKIVYGRKVRHVKHLDSSFTFLNLIFIDINHVDNIKEVIKHEEAHLKYFHGYDLLFFNLLAVPFWWVPSIWLMLYELKKLHEFQADAYALQSNSYKSYVSALIANTLTKKGRIITNSFNDIPITKRLKFMKQLKKRIAPAKTSLLVALVAIIVYTFSCQTQNMNDINQHIDDQLENEVFQVVDNPATPTGGIEEFYNYVSQNLKYPKEALDKGLSGKIFIQFVVQKDGRLDDIVVLRGIGAGCDEEAIRIIKNAPPWNPGQQSGRIVKQRMVLPITFRHPDYVEEIKQFEESLDNNKIEKDNSIQYPKPPTAPDQSTAKPTKVPTGDMPTFPGGIEKFYDYVQQNLKYPEKAKELGIEGKVMVQFDINTDGSVSNVSILRGIGSGCDIEAQRLMVNSPKWIPMKVKNEPQTITMVLPITFKIEK